MADIATLNVIIAADTAAFTAGMQKMEKDATAAAAALENAFAGVDFSGFEKAATTAFDGVKQAAENAFAGVDFSAVDQASKNAFAGVKALGDEVVDVGPKAKGSFDVFGSAAKGAAGSLEGLEEKFKPFSSLDAMVAGAAAALTTFAIDAVGSAISYVKSLGAEMLDMGAQMTALANKTGVSATALQELKFAAEQNGNSLEQVTNAVTTMAKKLEQAPQGARDAIRDLGLDFQALQSMAPEEAFTTIASAIAQIPDPMQQAALATQVFGGAAADILPTIKSDMAGLSDEARRLGLVIDNETIAALDALASSMDALSATIKGKLVAELTPFVPLLRLVVDGARESAGAVEQADSAWSSFWRTAQQAVLQTSGAHQVFQTAQRDAELLALAFSKAEGPAKGFADGIDAAAKAAKEGGKPITDLAQALDAITKANRHATGVALDAEAALELLGAGLTEDKRKAEEAAAAADKWAAALDRLTGRDILKGAAELTRQIKDAGGASALTADEFKKAGEQFAKAILLSKDRSVPQLWLDIAIATQLARDELVKYIDGIPQIGQRLRDLNPAQYFEDQARQIASILPKVQEGFTGLTLPGISFDEIVPAAAASGKKLGAEIGKAMSDGIVAAFAGGGNVASVLGASLGAVIGKRIGEEISKKITESLKGKVSEKIGTALGEAVGAIAGPLAALGTEALFNKLFGPSQEERVNDMRDSFIASAGGLGELNRKAHEAGLTLDGLLQAKTVKMFEAQVARLEAGFADVADKAAKAAEESRKFIDTLSKVSASGALLDRATVGKLAQVKPGTDEGAAAFDFFKSQTQAAGAGLKTFLDNATVTTQASANAMTASLGAVFEDMRLQGLSSTEAMAALGPTILTLSSQMEAAGLKGNAAFAELTAQAAIMGDEVSGPLVTAIGGIGQLMTGLANSGRINQEIFSGLTSQVTSTWKELEKMGKGGKAGVASIAPELQKIWELQQDYGFEVDASTQGLIDFGKESGVVGEQYRSDNDKMQKAVKELVERMDKLVQILEKSLPTAAGTAATEIEKKLNGIKPPILTIKYNYEQEGPGPPSAPTISTPGEVVGGGDVNVSVNIDGREIAEASTRYTAPVLAPLGV